MASEDTSRSGIELYDSALTLPSDSENYSANNEHSASPASTSSQVAVYKPPTIWRVLRGAAINLLLPFVNGLMLGLGELLAHEAAFRLGWSNTKVGTAPRTEAHDHGAVSAHFQMLTLSNRFSLPIDEHDLPQLALNCVKCRAESEVIPLAWGT